MKNKILWVVVAITVSLTMIGCQDLNRERIRKRDKIEHVARILMQNPHQFSLIVPNGRPNEYTVKEIEVTDAIFITDVPQDLDCWIEEIQLGSAPSTEKTLGNFHLHQIGEVEGGGWDHGKFGRGHTAVIE